MTGVLVLVNGVKGAGWAEDLEFEDVEGHAEEEGGL